MSEGATQTDISRGLARGGRATGLALLLLALVLAVLACAADTWQTQVVVGGQETVVTGRDLARLAPNRSTPVPVDQALWEAGARVVYSIEVSGTEFLWREHQEKATWAVNGDMTLGGERLRPARLVILPGPDLAAEGGDPARLPSLADVAPTVAHSLGLAKPTGMDGADLQAPRASRALIVVLDGFGYLTYQRMAVEGRVPILSGLGQPRMATSVYPSVTAAASATLLTGLFPRRHGVHDRSTRQTQAETIFDAATTAGLRVEAVEGEALTFNLRSAELTLSGDFDGNGSTDDNVLANALRVLAAGVPDLMWVHFHGIDDTSHTYGPGSAEVRECVSAVDAAVGELLARVPAGTLVVICADHGQHSVQEEEQLGNHGSLLPEDMLVPLWIQVLGEG